MSNTTTARELHDLCAVRRKRLADLMAGYDCRPDDVDGPGTRYLHAPADADPAWIAADYLTGRWALIVDRGCSYRILLVVGRDEIEPTAVRQLMDGWHPVCFYDLDTLAGEAPPPMEGDTVAYLPEHQPKEENRGPYEVLEIDHERGERQLRIAVNPEDTTWCDASWVEIVDRVHDDDRMPVRYGLAKIMVVFNSVPTDA